MDHVIRAYPYVWGECDLAEVLRVLPVLEDVLTAPDDDVTCERIPHPFSVDDMAALFFAGFDLQLTHHTRRMTRKERARLGTSPERMGFATLQVSPSGRGFGQR